MSKFYLTAATTTTGIKSSLSMAKMRSCNAGGQPLISKTFSPCFISYLTEKIKILYHHIDSKCHLNGLKFSVLLVYFEGPNNILTKLDQFCNLKILVIKFANQE